MKNSSHKNEGVPSTAKASESSSLIWEAQQYEQALESIFGYYALQIGHSPTNYLHNTRISHSWRLQTQPHLNEGVNSVTLPASTPCDLFASAEELPFSSDQFDLLILPHTLEHCINSHQVIREAARVLRPEGKLLISGNNRIWKPSRFFPKSDQDTSSIGLLRLKDWLTLLNFEIDVLSTGEHLPFIQKSLLRKQLKKVENLGVRYLPLLGGVYFVKATKKVPYTRLEVPRLDIVRRGLGEVRRRAV